MNATTIKELRLSKGWTQQALAERLGVSRQAVYKWENGKAAISKRTELAIRSLMCD